MQEQSPPPLPISVFQHGGHTHTHTHTHTHIHTPRCSSLQDLYEVRFKAFDPDTGAPIGDPAGQLGCATVPPQTDCKIKVDKSQFPPGTKFDVDVVAVTDGKPSESDSGDAYTST